MDDNMQHIQFDNKLRLTDLNADCLAELFKYLNISDLTLLSTANLTNHNNLDQAFTVNTDAASHPYERCIRDRFLQLNYSDDNITNNPDCVLFEKTVFRYFGSLISSVQIYYDRNYQRHSARIEQVIMEYGLALSEIGLINADVSAFENISEPFVHVTKLKFEDSWLGPTFFELFKWFPNLQSLSLHWVQMSDDRFIKQVIPNLMELSLKNKFLCQCGRMNRYALAENVLDYAISNLNLKSFLALMPNLKRLSLCHDRDDVIFEPDMQPNHFVIQINFDLLFFVASSLLQLCYLKLNIREMLFLHLPRYPIKFNELKTLIVETSDTNQLTQLPIASDALNHLEIIVDSFIDDNRILSEFVGRFESMEYLSIGHHPIDLEDDDLDKVIHNLMKLKVLQIASHKYKFADDLCFVVKRFDRVQTVRISCIEIASTDKAEFLESINENYFLKSKNWRGSIVSNIFEFERKMLM